MDTSRLDFNAPSLGTACSAATLGAGALGAPPVRSSLLQGNRRLIDSAPLSALKER